MSSNLPVRYKETHQQQKVTSPIITLSSDENETVITALQSKLLALENKYIDFVGRCANVLEENTKQDFDSPQSLPENIYDFMDQKKTVRNELDHLIAARGFKGEKNSKLKEFELKLDEIMQLSMDKKLMSSKIINEVRMILSSFEVDDPFKKKFESELQKYKEKYLKVLKLKDSEILKIKKEKDVLEKSSRDLHKQLKELKSIQTPCKPKVKIDPEIIFSHSNPARRSVIEKKSQESKYSPSRVSPTIISKLKNPSQELLKSYRPHSKDYSPLRNSRSNSPISRSVSPQPQENSRNRKAKNPTTPQKQLSNCINSMDPILLQFEADKKRLTTIIKIVEHKAKSLARAAKTFIDDSVRAERAIINFEIDKELTIEKAEISKSKLRIKINEFESDKFMEVVVTPTKNIASSLKFHKIEAPENVISHVEQELEKHEVRELKQEESEKIRLEFARLHNELVSKEMLIKDMNGQILELKTTIKTMKDIFDPPPREKKSKKIESDPNFNTDLRNTITNSLIQLERIFGEICDQLKIKTNQYEHKIKNLALIVSNLQSIYKNELESVIKNNDIINEQILENNKVTEDLSKVNLKNQKLTTKLQFLKEENSNLSERIYNYENNSLKLSSEIEHVSRSSEKKIRKLNKKLALRDDDLATKECEYKLYIDDLLSKINQLEHKIAKLKDECENVAYEKNNLQEQNQKIQNELDSLSITPEQEISDQNFSTLLIEKDLKIEELSTEIEELKNQAHGALSKLNMEIKKFDKIIKDSKQENQKLKSQNLDLQKQLKLSSDENEVTTKLLKDREQENSSISVKLQELLQENANSYQNMRFVKDEYEDKLKEFGRSLELAEFNYNSQLTDKDLVIEKQILEIENLKSQIQGRSSKLSMDLKKAQKDLKDCKQENSKINNQVKELIEQINQLCIEKDTQKAKSEGNETISRDLYESANKIKYLEDLNIQQKEELKCLESQNFELIEKAKTNLASPIENGDFINKNSIDYEGIIKILREITGLECSHENVLIQLPEILQKIQTESIELFARNSQLDKLTLKYKEEANLIIKSINDEKSSYKVQIQDLKISNYEITKKLQESSKEITKLEETLESNKLKLENLERLNEQLKTDLSQEEKKIAELCDENRELDLMLDETKCDYINQKSLIVRLTEEKELIQTQLQSAMASSHLSGNQLRDHNVQLQSQIALLESSNNSFAKMKLQLEGKNTKLEAETAEYIKLIEEKNAILANLNHKFSQMERDLLSYKNKLERADLEIEKEKKSNQELIKSSLNEQMTYETNIKSLENQIKSLKHASSDLKTSFNFQEKIEPDEIQVKSTKTRLLLEDYDRPQRSSSRLLDEERALNMLEIVKLLETHMEKSKESKLPDSLLSFYNKYSVKPQTASVEHDIVVISESPTKIRAESSIESEGQSLRDHDSSSRDGSLQSQEANYRAHFKILEQKKVIEELQKKLHNKKNKLLTTLELNKILKENIRESQITQERDIDFEALKTSFGNLLRLITQPTKEQQPLIQIIRSQLFPSDIVHSEESAKTSKKSIWGLFGKQ